MKKRVLFLPMLLLFLLPGLAQAETSSSVDRNPYHQEGVIRDILFARNLILHGRYDEALSAMEKFDRSHSDLIVWHLGKLAVYLVMMLENDNFEHDSQAMEALEELKRRFQDVSDQRPYFCEDYLFYGGAFGVLGLHETRRENYFSALRYGMTALYYLGRAGRIEEDFIDIHLGYGLYYYMRGYLAESLPWLPFFEDDRDRGFEELKIAEQGIYTEPVAKLAYIYIYGRIAEFEKAIIYTPEMHARYPESVLIGIEHGRALMLVQRYESARKMFAWCRERNQDNHKLLYYLGWASYNCSRTGNSDEAAELRALAQESLDAFLATRPDEVYSSYAHYLLGRIADQEGRGLLADKHYKKAFKRTGSSRERFMHYPYIKVDTGIADAPEIETREIAHRSSGM